MFEVSNFCIEANSLLDYAAAMSLAANELEWWKNLYRDIEFGLFAMQTTYREVSSNSLKEAEITFNCVLEHSIITYENLLDILETMRLCQRDFSSK